MLATIATIGTLGKTRRKLASNPFTEALLGRAGLSGPRLRVNRHFKPFDLNRPPSKSLSRFLPKKMFKSRYLEKKAQAEEAEANSQRKHRGVLRRELEWLKRGPKARSTKQKARIQRIEQMQETEFKQDLGKVDISTPGRPIGKKVIELVNVSKSYGDRTLIDNFSYAFEPEDRVGIIGGNGVGKSTLMDIITDRVRPDAGVVEIGKTIHIGYFDQHSESLIEDENQRAIEYLKEEGEFVKTADGMQISASQMLERFLFPSNQQYLPIHKLSGGEKRRLFLLRVLLSAPNLLILDEPTNDLDVQTLAVLEEYLEDFNLHSARTNV